MTPSQCTSLAPECVALIVPRTRLASLDILVATSDPEKVEPTIQLQAPTPSQRQVCLQLSVSQLVVLEGTSINGIPSTETDHISRLPSFRLARKGGRGVKTACVNCRNVGKRCDPGRPCSRCKRIGLQGCRDAPSKAKKPTGKRIVAGPAPNDPPSTSTAGTSVAMDQAPQPAPVDAASPTGSAVPEAMDASTQFWVPSPGYPASDAQMSDTYVGPSTFDAGDVGQMSYGYYDPAQDHLIRYSQTPSPPVSRADAVVGYPASHPHTMDMPEAPQDYFLLNVASSSDQSLAGFETHSSPQGPATGIQTPWPCQGW